MTEMRSERGRTSRAGRTGRITGTQSRSSTAPRRSERRFEPVQVSASVRSRSRQRRENRSYIRPRRGSRLPLSPRTPGGSSTRNRNARVWVTRALSFLPRQRPTLPRRCQRSTIGPGGLNCRVRDGNGCGPSGIATGTSYDNCGMSLEAAGRQPMRKPVVKPHGRLVPVGSTPYGAYTPGLSTWSSSRGLQRAYALGGLILERVSRLDAFSAYPCRT